MDKNRSLHFETYEEVAEWFDVCDRSGGRSLVYKFLPLLDRIDLSQIILWNLTEQAGFTGFFFAFSVSE